MALYQAGGGLNAEAIARLRGRQDHKAFSHLPAQDKSKQWENLLGSGATKKPRCSQCTRPLSLTDASTRQLVCPRCERPEAWQASQATGDVPPEPFMHDSCTETAQAAMPQTPSTASANSEEDAEAPVEPSKSSSPEEVLTAVKQHLLGSWTGPEGEHYSLALSQDERNIICTNQEDGSELGEPRVCFLDLRERLVWWGINRSYFLDLTELKRQSLTWHDSGNGMAQQRNMEWKRGDKVKNVRVKRWAKNEELGEVPTDSLQQVPAEPVSKKTGSNKIRQADRQEAEVPEQVDVDKPPVKAQASKEEVKPVVQAPKEEIKQTAVQAPREEIKQKPVQAPKEEIKQKTVQAPKEEIKQKTVQAPKEDIKQKPVGRKDEIRQRVPQYSSKAEAGKIDVKQVASYSSSSSSSMRQVAPWKNVDEAYSGWAASKEHWTGDDWSERWNEHWTSTVQPEAKKESKAWKSAQPDPKKDLKAPESQWKLVTSPKAEAKSTTAWRTVETPTEETKEVKEVKEVKVWRPVVTPKEEVNAQVVVDPKQEPKVETPKEESKEVKEVKEVKVWKPVVETAQEESKEAKEVKEVKDVKAKAVESKQEPKVWRPVESPKEEVTSKTEQHHAKQEAKVWKAVSVPEKRPPKRQAVKENEWTEWNEWSEWHEWVESKPEKKQEKKNFKDETTRLAEAAIKIITGQVKVPENKGFVWVDEWQERFSATLGTVREFLESRPDKFQVMPTSGRGYRVALVKQEYAKWKTTKYW